MAEQLVIDLTDESLRKLPLCTLGDQPNILGQYDDGHLIPTTLPRSVVYRRGSLVFSAHSSCRLTSAAVLTATRAAKVPAPVPTHRPAQRQLA